jgi:stage II sporulation protein D
MINQEPIIKVGIFEGCPEARGSLQGKFAVANVIGLKGDFVVRSERGTIIFTKADGQRILSEEEITCQPLEQGSFLLKDVKIGINFHWQRQEDQIFEGRLRLIAQEGRTIAAVNEISLESYLKSVISSEMSALSPIELLKVHAITSRSWLVAMLERRKKAIDADRTPLHSVKNKEELIRWYGREDHLLYDVCADDHCQRYQGISKIVSDSVSAAVEATRGTFLVWGEEVCDARYSKACGGLTENFDSVWEQTPLPYLRSISDSVARHRPIKTEQDAARWIRTQPEAYCNTSDVNILRQILPAFDQETVDFFRWKVSYAAGELNELVKTKSGTDFGSVHDLIPVERGPSGRIIRLKIVGSKKTLTIGKELEIRKWLSPSHLYSSAFTVEIERDPEGNAQKFILTGAGWGHGVGLCQIGAAVMAAKGFGADEILRHYFKDAELVKLY